MRLKKKLCKNSVNGLTVPFYEVLLEGSALQPFYLDVLRLKRFYIHNYSFLMLVKENGQFDTSACVGNSEFSFFFNFYNSLVCGILFEALNQDNYIYMKILQLGKCL